MFGNGMHTDHVSYHDVEFKWSDPVAIQGYLNFTSTSFVIGG